MRYGGQSLLHPALFVFDLATHLDIGLERLLAYRTILEVLVILEQNSHADSAIDCDGLTIAVRMNQDFSASKALLQRSPKDDKYIWVRQRTRMEIKAVITIVLFSLLQEL